MSRTFQKLDAVDAADEIAARSCVDTLRGLNRDIVLFTPALLVTHGRFDRDPVMEFGARFPAEHADLRPFLIELKRDNEFFFRGLGESTLPGRKRPINWNKRLYAIDARRKEECFAFFSGLAFSDIKNGFFASTFGYDLVISDPTSRLNESLNVRIFGVVANQFVAFIDTQPVGPPIARRIPMVSTQGSLQFLQNKGLLSSFTGEDPLLAEE